MKADLATTPKINDATAKEKTGKSLKEWFAVLDKKGGLDAGRRELTNYLYSEAKVDEWWSVTIAVEYEIQAGQKEKDGKPKGYSICSTKTIAAPIDKVYGAFGDSKQLDRWLGSKSKAEFKDGGAYSNADGDKGTFTRLRANKDIRLTWDNPKLAPGTQVEVLFADKGKGKTGITLNHTRLQSRADADAIRAGWADAFDKLKSCLEGG